MGTFFSRERYEIYFRALEFKQNKLRTLFLVLPVTIPVSLERTSKVDNRKGREVIRISML